MSASHAAAVQGPDIPPGTDLLRQRVRGRVLTVDDPTMLDGLAPFNPVVRHRPDLVVEAVDGRDVAAALDWATEHSRPWVVQGTGHAETPCLGSGVVITTREMSSVTVDAAARTARAGAGARWRQVLEAAEPYGLVPVCGSAPDVGIVGLLLGGGVGPVGRSLGACSDHVRAVHLVLPGVGPTTVDASRNPELFAALLGGRPDVGVVTAVDLALLPQQPLQAGGLYYGPDDIPAVLAAFQGWLDDGVPDEVTTSLAIIRIPDLPSVPPPLAGRTVAHLRMAAVGRAGRDVLPPAVQRAATPLLGAIAPMAWADIGAIHGDPVTPRVHVGGGRLLSDVTPGTVDALLDAAGPEVTTPLSIVEIRHLGGAFASVPSDRPDCVPGRDASFGVWISSQPFPLEPDHPGPAAQNATSAVRAALEALTPWSDGAAAVNFSGSVNTADEVRRGWSPTAHSLIDAARRRYSSISEPA